MPQNPDITNFHMQYLDVTSQHWNPDSAQFAGGDHLMTALDNGWQIENCRLVKHWYAGMRFVKIYEFNMVHQRSGDKMTMPVIDNPYIQRFIEEEHIELIDDDNTHETV